MPTLIEYLARRAQAEQNIQVGRENYVQSGYAQMENLERRRIEEWSSLERGAVSQCIYDIRTARRTQANPATGNGNKREYIKWAWCRREILEVAALLDGVERS